MLVLAFWLLVALSSLLMFAFGRLVDYGSFIYLAGLFMGISCSYLVEKYSNGKSRKEQQND